ncbi:hypothetical protein [Micromonospora sp. NPDC093277]
MNDTTIAAGGAGTVKPTGKPGADAYRCFRRTRPENRTTHDRRD